MAKDMAIRVVVKLLDRITGPIDRIMAKMRAFAALGSQLGNLGRRIEEISGKVGKLSGRIGAIGALGAGLSFAAPVQAAAKFDDVVRDIGITADLTGDKLEAMIRSVSPALEKLSLEVGQKSIKLAEGLRVLVASGLDLPTGQGLMRTVGRVATAAGAEVEEVARTAFSLSNNLKISMEDMELAMAKLVTAGKLGRFEFKDMARELPELTAGIQRFGMTGMEAVSTLGASLQVVMTGTSLPSVAANNLSELFGKFFSPDVIKNFKEKFNTDILGTIGNAKARGLNPFEAAMEKLLSKTQISAEEVKKVYDEATAGGANQVEAFEKVREHLERIGAAAKIQEIFGDKQALNAIIPILANLDKYREFKSQIAMADTAIIARDLAGRLAGLTAKIDGFAEISEQAMRRVGKAFSLHLPMLTEGVAKLMQHVERLDQAHPGLIDKMLAWGGAALLVTAALGILGPSALAVAAGARVIFAVLKWGTLVVALLSRAFVALGAAMLATPVGWVIAGITGIATAAYLIYKYWEPIKGFFQDLWTSVESTFRSFGDRLAAWWEGLIPEWARPLIRGAAAGIPGAGLLQAAGSAMALAGGPGPASQKQEVGGKIVVQVEGPGKVTSITSDSRAVPIEADRGQMLWVP